MLLVFDVGNTNMVIGIYKDKSLVKDWRICTDIHKTSDEYGMLIGNLLAHDNIDIKSIDDVIISSVVPNVGSPNIFTTSSKLVFVLIPFKTSPK